MEKGILAAVNDTHKSDTRLLKMSFLEPYALLTFGHLGPVSRKPRKILEPVKPFLVHLYLKTEKCIRLKFLLRREPLFILIIRE